MELKIHSNHIDHLTDAFLISKASRYYTLGGSKETIVDGFDLNNPGKQNDKIKIVRKVFMNKIAEFLEHALKKGELRKYLTGSNEYNIASRDGFFTDISAALYSGIYEYYKLKPESNINVIFESELASMLEGSEFEIMCAFEYFWRQIFCESRMTAPFELGKESILKLKNTILQKEDLLKNYKERWEFGAQLENGAYQYVQNIGKSIEEQYGRKLV